MRARAFVRFGHLDRVGLHRRYQRPALKIAAPDLHPRLAIFARLVCLPRPDCNLPRPAAKVFVQHAFEDINFPAFGVASAAARRQQQLMFPLAGLVGLAVESRNFAWYPVAGFGVCFDCVTMESP